jgi:exosome complex component RRP45
MPREPEPSQNEKDFVLKLLEDERRLDGRSFSEYRKLELTFGDELGVAEVQLGKTRHVTLLSFNSSAQK